MQIKSTFAFTATAVAAAFLSTVNRDPVFPVDGQPGKDPFYGFHNDPALQTTAAEYCLKFGSMYRTVFTVTGDAHRQRYQAIMFEPYAGVYTAHIFPLNQKLQHEWDKPLHRIRFTQNDINPEILAAAQKRKDDWANEIVYVFGPDGNVVYSYKRGSYNLRMGELVERLRSGEERGYAR